MSSGSFAVRPDLAEYALRMSDPEPEIFQRLRKETATQELAVMQIGHDQALFMAVLARLIDARAYLELGVFTGYSSLAVALAMPADGRIVACDVSEEFTAIARRYWTEAGVDAKVDLRLAPALETLGALQKEDRIFDMAFIDADKPNMAAYFDWCVRLVRPNGLILIDNVLWSGDVVDDAKQDESVAAIRVVNELVRKDSRVEKLMLPIFDGITVARKK